MTTTIPAALSATLQTYGQEHLLRFWPELSDASRQQLLGQLQEIDWANLDQLIKEYVLGAKKLETDLSTATPAPYYPLVPSAADRDFYLRARQHGEGLLKAGKVAGFTVAGGQGTRLGFDAPKGTFPIGPISGKSLFQIFAEGLARAQEKYHAVIPWYIMTSPINDAATRAFFQENQFFGLDSRNVRFFPQGTMPAIGLDGKLLLGAKDSLALSPNGHGGALLAMRTSGALADMRQRGVEHISYWQVDNATVYVIDPLYLGMHDLKGSEMSCRSLTKTGPFEKLGNFTIINGRLEIIEYSDMPNAMAEALCPDGQLCYRAGSPAVHAIRRDFVEKLTGGGLSLPAHRADKKIPYVDAAGAVVTPDKPNGIKLEMFIFDALPLAELTLILEMSRTEQIAPVKNATGIDSVESSRDLIMERSATWLEAAGIQVPRKEDGSLDCRVELSPRRYLFTEDVAAAKSTLVPPKRGESKYYP
jgi:UDP-N-acetylglucosamine/UDP-N-acetylgalactosamine diphosphorylase